MFPVFTQVPVWLLWLAVRFRQHDRCLFHFYVPCFPQLGHEIIGSGECNFVRLSRFSPAALCFRSLSESFAFDTCGSWCDSQLNISPARKPRLERSWELIAGRVAHKSSSVLTLIFQSHQKHCSSISCQLLCACLFFLALFGISLQQLAESAATSLCTVLPNLFYS